MAGASLWKRLGESLELTMPDFKTEIRESLGVAVAVAVAVGVGVTVGETVAVGVDVGVAVAVGVGVGVEPDCAQYLPPVLNGVISSHPPQTII